MYICRKQNLTSFSQILRWMYYYIFSNNLAINNVPRNVRRFCNECISSQILQRNYFLANIATKRIPRKKCNETVFSQKLRRNCFLAKVATNFFPRKVCDGCATFLYLRVAYCDKLFFVASPLLMSLCDELAIFYSIAKRLFSCSVLK